MKKVFVLTVPGMMLLTGLVAAWYMGWLAPLYAHYPTRNPLPTLQPNDAIKVIAHRGGGEVAPENTLPAFRAAIASGLEYIEVDTRLSADGVPVVMHDTTVDRTTNAEGDIDSFSFAELQTLDAGSWFSPEYSGTRIPTLQQVLDESLGKTCVLVDLKVVPNSALIEMLKEYAAKVDQHCLLISIRQPYSLKDNDFPLDQLSPQQIAGLELRAAERSETHYSQYRAFQRYWPEFSYAGDYKSGDSVGEIMRKYPGIIALEIRYTSITPELVKEAHENGLWVYSHVPLSEGLPESVTAARMNAKYLKIMDAGADGIFTEDVPGLVGFLKNYRQQAE